MAGEYAVTREGEGAGALVLRRDGHVAGRLDYRVAGTVIEIDYVVVDEVLRGHGVGRRLVEAAVAWARDTGRTLRPYCGYAARVLGSDGRFSDVLERGRA